MLVHYMPESEDVGNQGTSIHAGGDVIGVNVRGNKNIIGKNMNVTQTNTEINQITISPQVLSKLDEQYANAFKQVIESINNQIVPSKDVKPEVWPTQCIVPQVGKNSLKISI